MTPKEVFTIIREKYRPMYEICKKNHSDALSAGKGNMGHGFDHDLRVAQKAFLIAENNITGEMAWCAGLMHSTDRLFVGQEFSEKIDEYRRALKEWFFPIEINMILEAVRVHSKMNDPNDNPITITLKDADKISNLGAMNFIRCGQHRPNIPACYPEYIGTRHPETTFRNIKSCYDASWFNLEWEEMLRLPKAKAMGKKHFDRIREWQRWVIDEMEEVGLFPFPKD